MPPCFLVPLPPSTTAASAPSTPASGAGTVSIVVPFIADQPFWGAQLHSRGLGPAPIRRSRLTAERLMAALEQIPSYQARVDAASASMRDEDGTAAALRVLESLR